MNNHEDFDDLCSEPLRSARIAEREARRTAAARERAMNPADMTASEVRRLALTYQNTLATTDSGYPPWAEITNEMQNHRLIAMRAALRYLPARFAKRPITRLEAVRVIRDERERELDSGDATPKKRRRKRGAFPDLNRTREDARQLVDELAKEDFK